MQTQSMSLVTCPVCNTEVSATAYQCPKCAHILRKPTRSFMGKIIKWLFIGYNLLMIWWLIAGLAGTGETMKNASSEAARTGTAVGATIGVGIIFFFWVTGVIILGAAVMFTRPKAH